MISCTYMYRMNKAIKLLQSSKKDWTTKELQVFWKIKNKNTLYTTIKRYVKQGVLFRIKKGEYSTKPINEPLIKEKVIKQARKMVKESKLLWYVKDYDQLTMESVLEAVLGYGNWQEVKSLVELVGKKKLALTYNRLINQSRVNLRPETINFFNLYFKKYD